MSSYLSDSNVYPSEFSNCPDFLERYLIYLKNNRGKRPLTLSEATLLLREFCQYVHYKNVIREVPSTADAHKDMGISNMTLDELASLRTTDIEEYIGFLAHKAHNSESTIYKKLSIIRTFFSYLVRIQSETGVRFTEGNPTPRMAAPSSGRSSPVKLSIKQIQRMIDAVCQQGKRRDLAVLLILATSGVTISELASIEVTDVLDNGWLRVNGNNGIRYVWLTPECQRAINEYLFSAERDVYESDTFLFQSYKTTGQKITPRTIRNIVSRAAEAAVLKNHEDVTPTAIREAVVTVLYDTAAAHEQANVSHYLGYRTASQHRSSSIDTRKRFAVDSVMEDLVRRSSLISLGYGQVKEDG